MDSNPAPGNKVPSRVKLKPALGQFPIGFSLGLFYEAMLLDLRIPKTF